MSAATKVRVLPACYSVPMSNIQIKNVSPEVHAELRRRAGEAGLTIRDYVLWLIEKDQRIPTKQDWLDQLAEVEPVDTGESAVEMVQRAREEADRELDEKLERLYPDSGGSGDDGGR